MEYVGILLDAWVWNGKSIKGDLYEGCNKINEKT